MRSEKEISKCVTVLTRLLAGLDVDRVSIVRYLPPGVSWITVNNDSFCPFCGKVFRKKSNLVWHLSRAHAMDLKRICRGD